MSDTLRPDILSRRRALQLAGGGFAAAALDSMLRADESHHHQPKATRVIQIFCPGGMSQVDTFDYKPELKKRAGQSFDPDGKLQFFASKPGNCQPGFWRFRQHGQSGRWISSLFPGLSSHVDDMAFIYSMHSKSALHGPGCFMMNTGFTLPGFPSMGSWVTYGLGSEADDLPASQEHEQNLVVDCDLSLINTARTHWPFFRDRRIDAYGGLVDRWAD